MSESVAPVSAAKFPSGRARLLGIVLVAVALGAGVAVGGATGGSEPRTTLQPAGVAAEVAPPGSQSSSWYCTGGTGPGEPLADATILVANAGPRRVTGTVHVVDTKGEQAVRSFAILPGTQIEEHPGAVVRGDWLAARIDVVGGGVTASERVDGKWGTSVSPCASETSRRWYFAQGTTVAGASLFASLFNPTASLAVVDVTFLTASGVISPAPDQGIVIGPGKLVTLTVGEYVQRKREIATIVSARSGAIAATELQLYGVEGVTGAALVAGTPEPEGKWELPQLLDVQGGASDLEVLNPSTRASAHVRVEVRLPTGTDAPFDEIVPPSSVWTLETSAQLRIPEGTDYSLEVTAAGTSGVVVGRMGEGTTSGPAPQWGSEVGIAAPGTGPSAATTWVLPSMGTAVAASSMSTTSKGTTSQGTTIGGAGVLVVKNVSGTSRRAVVYVATAAGRRRVRILHIRAHGTSTMPAQHRPMVVDADGPVAIQEVGSAPGTGGFVGVPAVPEG